MFGVMGWNCRMGMAATWSTTCSTSVNAAVVRVVDRHGADGQPEAIDGRRGQAMRFSRDDDVLRREGHLRLFLRPGC